MPAKKRARRKPLTKNQYKQVARIANKQIHKMSELKTYDGSAFNTSTVVSPADGFTNIRQVLSFPPQGDGDANRDGDSIYLRSLSLNGWLDCGADQAIVQRHILIQWLEDDTNSAGPPVRDNTPRLSDILEDITSGFASINSHYKKQPQKRFKVLDDRTYAWDSNVASAPKPYRVRLSTKDFGIKKPQMTPGANSGTGKFYLFSFGNVTDVTAGMNSCQFRYRYFDN